MSWREISSEEIATADRVSTDRPDYTVEPVPINVSVQQERAIAALIIKTSADIPPTAGYDSEFFQTGNYNKLIGILFSNRACTIYIEQSIDGTNIHSQQTQAYTASSVLPAESMWSYEITAPYIRVKVIPATTPTIFQVWSRLSSGA